MGCCVSDVTRRLLPFLGNRLMPDSALCREDSPHWNRDKGSQKSKGLHRAPVSIPNPLLGKEGLLSLRTYHIPPHTPLKASQGRFLPFARIRTRPYPKSAPGRF